MRSSSKKSRSQKQKVVWGVVIGGLAVAALAAAAGRERHGLRDHRHGGSDWSIKEIEDRLEKHAGWLDRYGVDEEQRAALVAELRAVQPEIERLRSAKGELETEIAELLAAEVIDQARLDELRGEVIALTEQATRLGFDTMIQLADDLSAEQRRELVEHWRSR